MCKAFWCGECSRIPRDVVCQCVDIKSLEMCGVCPCIKCNIENKKSIKDTNVVLFQPRC